MLHNSEYLTMTFTLVLWVLLFYWKLKSKGASHTSVLRNDHFIIIWKTNLFKPPLHQYSVLRVFKATWSYTERISHTWPWASISRPLTQKISDSSRFICREKCCICPRNFTAMSWRVISMNKRPFKTVSRTSHALGYCHFINKITS